MLKLEKITKDYVVDKNVTHALKGIDIEFRPGEFVAILGPSGCGKTTLLNIIGGLDRYTSGDIYVNGRSTKEYEDYDWDRYRNKTIGFIFQNYNLIMHQTILSNVELALTLIGVGRAERKRRALAALESVGLSDHVYKKPNQLSGGQMQRVAIARAIVNDPKILLADEPTGALDSESSQQVMDILKELSKDRLVIMVTHNDDLAKEYADRIVRIKDGVVQSDSAPYESGIEPEPARPKEKNLIKRLQNFIKHGRAEKHTSMSYESAIRLSANNLSTKKMRTALTSFAGSIGIIGIAIVLSLSSGFSGYIASMEEGALASYPIVVGAESGFNLQQAMSSVLQSSNKKEEDLPPLFSDMDDLYIQNVLAIVGFQYLTDSLTGKNTDLTEFTKFLDKNWDANLGYYKYNYNVGLQLWSDNVRNADGTQNKDGKYTRIYPFADLMEGTNFESYIDMVSNMTVIEEMPSNETMNAQYDVIYGRMPSEDAADEIILFVDSRNQIVDFMLLALGIVEIDTNTSVLKIARELDKFKDGLDFENLVYDGEEDEAYLEYKVTTTGDGYTRATGDQERFVLKDESMRASEAASSEMTLKVVGVARVKEGVENTSMSGALGYTNKLTEWLIEHNNATEVVQTQLASKDRNVIYSTNSDGYWTNEETKETDYENALATLGYSVYGKPATINIFAASIDSKEKIIAMIDEYNDNALHEKGQDAIPYTDMLGEMMDFINSLSDTVTYVMVGFSSISLVVSCIMIGIITYISVLERTKEIGILRSIGARKRDIARVFNAETFMIGLLSGIIGVVFTCIVYFPANAILYSVLGIANLFTLVWWQLVGLIIISVVLTLISGFIPAHMAAKKDPVIALRSE